MTHLDLFSGIGGNSLAADSIWPGIQHIFCENADFPAAILRKHWPNAKIYGDIKELKGAEILEGGIDLLTGGFPCQPFSSAGKRGGTEDDRHLWPEMLRVIRETTPEWIIAENVSGLLTWNDGVVLEGIIADLESENYEVWPFVIPACSVNAPHRRDRVWIVAHPRDSDAGGNTRKHARKSKKKWIPQRDQMEQPSVTNQVRLSFDSDDDGSRGRERQGSEADGISEVDGERILSGEFGGTDSVGIPANAQSGRHGGRSSEKRGASKRFILESEQQRSPLRSEDERRTWNAWPEAVARLCTLDDGLPGGLVRPRGWRDAAIKAAGNSIVPSVAQEIMRAIKYTDSKI